MKFFSLFLGVAAYAGICTVLTGQALAAGDTYRDVVLADNPYVYYEFEDLTGSGVALDSSGNGRDSLFVGSRNIPKSFDFGFEQVSEVNVNFEVPGRAGNAFEFLNRDSVGWENVTCEDNIFVAQVCEDYAGGGYIETGVTLDINDDDSDVSNGNNPISWSVEISIKDDDISDGPAIIDPNNPGVLQVGTFSPAILGQRQFGPDGDNDILILGVGTFAEGNGTPGQPEEDKHYASGFGKVLTEMTTTPFDPNGTLEANAGNPLTFEGRWQTIAITYQVDTNEMRWYSEGQLVRTATVDNAEFNSVDDSWFLATNPRFGAFGEVFYFSGLIDEFSVYDYQLTDAQVLAHFNAFAPSGTPGDFDADGDVDGNDFLTWQRTQGDASSLSDWETNFGTTSALSAATVPEPGSLLLAGIAAVATWTACRRHRLTAM